MADGMGEVCERMTANLDKIVIEESKTADLTLGQKLEFSGVGKVKVPKIDMDGLADYNRKDGYVDGSVDLEWEERTLEYDRGRGFDIDIMDDDERMRIVSANLMAQFARTRVIPEVDAVRFARMAQNAGKTVQGGWSDADDLLEVVLDAETDFEDAGNELASAIFYCTSAVKNALRKAMPYRMGMGETPNMRFEVFDEMRIITVPSNRFYTEVKLEKGTAGGGEAGSKEAGYTKGESGNGIDFMIVNPSVVQAITKHQTLRYFSPEIYQKKNAHHWDYRLFHDLIMLDNAKGGVYVSMKSE